MCIRDRDRGIKPFYIKYSDSEDRIENLCKNIKILVKEFNYKYDDVSIIALNDQSMKDIKRCLDKEKIKYVNKNGAGEGINTVSYTHLDVYKRQALHLPSIFLYLHLIFLLHPG